MLKPQARIPILLQNLITVSVEPPEPAERSGWLCQAEAFQVGRQKAGLRKRASGLGL